MKIIEKEFNVITNEEIIIERDATAEEIAEIEENQAKAKAKTENLITKAAARQAILNRLGLTADEAALLLGAN